MIHEEITYPIADYLVAPATKLFKSTLSELRTIDKRYYPAIIDFETCIVYDIDSDGADIEISGANTKRDVNIYLWKDNHIVSKTLDVNREKIHSEIKKLCKLFKED